MRKDPRKIEYTGFSELETKIKHYRYSDSTFEEISDLFELDDDKSDLIIIEGFKNQKQILDLTRKINVHHFFVQDIFHVNQRNKVEVVENQVFMILKYPIIEQDNLKFRYISFLLQKALIVVFTDYENDYMKILLDRVSKNTALFTSYDESYIIYAVYDIIIDQQLDIADNLRQELEEIEGIIMETNDSISKDLYRLHKNLVQLRNNAQSLNKNLSPKELLSNGLLNPNIEPFILDLEDHIVNLVEKLNTSIEICNSLITMYSNYISNKTNEVMKILTIISVIFIPLSFLAGVFGMNFTSFAVLEFKYGLALFFGFSLFTVVMMLFWFKHNKWI